MSSGVPQKAVQGWYGSMLITRVLRRPTTDMVKETNMDIMIIYKYVAFEWIMDFVATYTRKV